MLTHQSPHPSNETLRQHGKSSWSCSFQMFSVRFDWLGKYGRINFPIVTEKSSILANNLQPASARKRPFFPPSLKFAIPKHLLFPIPELRDRLRKLFQSPFWWFFDPNFCSLNTGSKHDVYCEPCSLVLQPYPIPGPSQYFRGWKIRQMPLRFWRCQVQRALIHGWSTMNQPVFMMKCDEVTINRQFPWQNHVPKIEPYSYHPF